MNARETDGVGPANRGDHDRVRYVAMLYALLQAGRSGVLEVESGPRWRRLYLVEGQPAWYESNLEAEDLARTLVSSGVVSRRQVKWIQGKLSEGEKLEDALVAAGTLSSEDVAVTQRNQVERGYTAPLSWAKGTWTFTPCDALEGGRIDPALRMDVEPLHALWEGVKLHIEMDDVLQAVSDPEAGPVRLTEGFGEEFAGFRVEDALQELPTAAEGEPTVEELFKRIPDRSGNLAKLLWLLQTVELVQREGRAEGSPLAEVRSWLAALGTGSERISWIEEPGDTDGDLGDTAEDLMGGRSEDDEESVGDGVTVRSVGGADEQKGAGPSVSGERGSEKAKARRKPKPPARTPEEYADLLRNAHRHRMGKDYYAFLAVAPTSSLAEIKKAYGRLAKRCKKARSTEGLSSEAQELAKELLNAARRVWLTLSDDALRAAYNRRLDAGDAPVVRGRRKAGTVRLQDPNTQSPRPSQATADLPAFEQAKILMANGDHERARKLLERARRDNPSSPDILADLGWCTWMVLGRTTGDASEAEEFLRLAVAFNPRHDSALEFLARIAVERGDAENARARVKALLRVVPNSGWGTQALQGLGREAGTEPVPSGRLRFWKKKR